MCLLQLSGFEWQPEYHNNPTKMPMGRLPVLRNGEQLIPDSAHIQAHLEQKGVDFNAGLSDVDKSHAHALIQMAEAGIYNILVHDRWLVDENWEITRKAFFHVIPGLIRGPLTRKFRKNVRNKLMAQGTAQFSEAERVEHMKRDLNALSMQLGDQKFLFGAMPTAADAAIAPVLDMIINLPVKTGARELLKGWDGLPAYVARMRSEVYPTL
jgi:glutathione S-transferase